MDCSCMCPTLPNPITHSAPLHKRFADSIPLTPGRVLGPFLLARLGRLAASALLAIEASTERESARVDASPRKHRSQAAICVRRSAKCSLHRSRDQASDELPLEHEIDGNQRRGHDRGARGKNRNVRRVPPLEEGESHW